MDSCHYCCDTIEKLNEEFNDVVYEYEYMISCLEKEFNVINNITKKNNYKHCLIYIKLLRISNLEMYPAALEDFNNGDRTYFNTIEEINDKYGDNSKALLYHAKRFDDEDKRNLDEFYLDK